jgi:hypothetical protein
MGPRLLRRDAHHIDDANPNGPPAANLYVFGAPPRFGGPIDGMKRFLKKIKLPVGTKYAIFSTNGELMPNKKTGQMPSEEEVNRMRGTIPSMDEILNDQGMVKIADKIFLVSAEDMKGHLMGGWQERFWRLRRRS